MKNKLLVSAQKVLHGDINSSFQDDNILELSTEKNGSPFAFLIVEHDIPDAIILCFSADFHDVQLAARVAIDLGMVAQVELGEEFFISVKKQKLYWGSEAIEMSMLESPDINENLKILLDSEPINGLKC